MKKILLLTAGILFLFNNASAQLVADAGPDFEVCHFTPFTIGGTPAATGGTPPYTYSWTNQILGGWTDSVSNPTISYLPANLNRYYLLVTDSLGAQSRDTVLVIIYNDILISLNGTDTTGCVGSSISFVSSASGGVPPYSYLWNFGDGTNSTQGPNTQHVYSAAGTYVAALTVTDSICGVNQYIDIAILPSCGGFSIVQQNPLCFGMCNGLATVVPQGNYRYLWSNGGTAMSANNLCTGTYSVTVMDSTFAPLDTLSVNISQPPPLSAVAVATNVSCNGLSNGSITTNTTGGTPPYTYLWSFGITVPNPTNLSPGTYVATVTDGNACSASAMATILEPALLVVTTSAVDASGCGVCDGSATVTVSGGTGAYTYLWSNTVVTPVLNNLCPGVYICTITDANACSDTAITTVNATGSTLNVSTTASQVNCIITTGSASTAVNGGVPPYSFAWSTGDTTVSVLGLAAGLYTVSVTDSSGCSGFGIANILDARSYNYFVYVSGVSTNCGNNGSATATPSGGVPPYTYLWNTTPPQTTQTATGLMQGSYAVTVTDSVSCQRTGTVQILNGGCNNIIHGRLIRDLNGNCALDSGETPLPGKSVIADGTNNYFATTDAQGYYSIRVPAGTYNIRPSQTSSCLVNCSGLNVSYNHTFASVGDTFSNVSFYLVPAPFNLYVSNSWAGFRPGFYQNINIYYGNTGTDTVNGTLTYAYDSDLIYQSSSGNGIHDSINHTITWTLADIIPSLNNNSNTFVTVIILTPIGTPLNTPIVNGTYISGPTGECDSTDNVYIVSTTVRGSYDPNDKAVSPAGDIFEEDSMLTYTIRFQNTGNDTAWFVILKDTLSSYLEPGSVENLASSHPITEFKVEGEGILTWVFNPIYLVDSFTNEPASHGYVIFRVKKRSGLPLSTTISNTAHIYFDYNEPVVTNTITNTLTEPNFVFTVRGDENISVMAMPNPFTQQTQIVVEGINSAFDFELFDVTGKVMKKISSVTEDHFELQREDMSTGVYFYRITTTQKQRAFGRVVVE